METCSQHGKMMEMLGRIDERTETMKKDQDTLVAKVETLGISSAVEKIKVRPVFWVIAAVAGAAITGIVSRLF